MSTTRNGALERGRERHAGQKRAWRSATSSSRGPAQAIQHTVELRSGEERKEELNAYLCRSRRRERGSWPARPTQGLRDQANHLLAAGTTPNWRRGPA